MSDKIEIKLPMTVKNRIGREVTIVKYTKGNRQPWIDSGGLQYSNNGRFLIYGTSEADIVDGLPDMSETFVIDPVITNIKRITVPAHKFLIGWTAVAHIALPCILSITLHVITDLRIVYWWHDLIWPTSWIEKQVEK